LLPLSTNIIKKKKKKDLIRREIMSRKDRLTKARHPIKYPYFLDYDTEGWGYCTIWNCLIKQERESTLH
jgi:hypothetical protein